MAAIPLSLILACTPSPFSTTALIRQYIALSVEPDMCPRKIVFEGGELIHRPLTGQPGEAMEAEHVLIMRSLRTELTMPFSFLEYGSHTGNLSLLLARHYKNSSIMSMEADKDSALEHWEQVKLLNRTNNIVLNTDASSSLVQKLFESPEFLRYQVAKS